MVRVLVSDRQAYLGKIFERKFKAADHEIVETSADAEDFATIVKEGTDVIVLDLVRDGARCHKLLNILSEGGWEEPKTVIGISSVLTWNETKPKKNKPLNEDDYKNRKCTPRFKELKLLETLVLNAKNDLLTTTVVAAGLLYGCGEDAFSDLFRDAWMCEGDSLTVIGDGSNTLPILHVEDCANFVEKMIAVPPEGKDYVVLVDNSDLTQQQIVETVAKGLGNGQVTTIAADEESLLLDDSDAAQTMTTSLVFDKEALWLTSLGEIEWHNENFLNTFDKVRLEFVQTRKLTPLRIALLGPPGAGKTFYAKKMCKEYSIPHVVVEDVIKEALAAGDALAEKAHAALQEQAAIPGAKSGKSKKKPAAKAAPKKGKGKGKPDDRPQLPAPILAEMVTRKLMTTECRNKGFVLDGFPRSFQEASALFEAKKAAGDDEDAPPEEPAEGEEGVEKPVLLDENIMVQYLISMEVAKDAAQTRIMDIPEADVVEGHNDEEGFHRRWAMYEYILDEKPEGPTDPIPFFTTLEVLEVPQQIAASEDTGNAAIKGYVESGGRPFNFHPTPKEVAAALAIEDEKRKREEGAAKELAERQEKEERDKRAMDEAANARRKDIVLSEDAQLVEEASLPLRKYLMKNVIPPLVDGLLDVCKTQPEDPIDYLAEYLFQYSMNQSQEAAP